jgi:hypothetical protein
MEEYLRLPVTFSDGAGASSRRRHNKSSTCRSGGAGPSGGGGTLSEPPLLPTAVVRGPPGVAFNLQPPSTTGAGSASLHSLHSRSDDASPDNSVVVVSNMIRAAREEALAALRQSAIMQQEVRVGGWGLGGGVVHTCSTQCRCLHVSAVPRACDGRVVACACSVAWAFGRGGSGCSPYTSACCWPTTANPAGLVVTAQPSRLLCAGVKKGGSVSVCMGCSWAHRVRVPCAHTLQ